MKLLLDQGTPRSAAERLRQAGTDAIHVGDIGHAEADDAAILQLARDQGRAIVTLDADFHALLALGGATSPSVIRIRVEGLKGDELAALVTTVLGQCTAELGDGAAVTVQANRIRLRRLPLVRG